MIIVVDDSGGPGIGAGRSVSSYFAIAAVHFKDDADAEKVAERIDLLKRELGWKERREFKFRKTNTEIRTKFFEAIKRQKFEVSAVLLEKDKLDLKQFHKNASKLYNMAILRAIQGLGVDLENANVYIDGEAGNDYRRKAKTFFRQNLPAGAIKELVYEDSVGDPLIQLADMIVGAIRYTLSNKKDADDYYLAIKRHVVTITKTL